MSTFALRAALMAGHVLADLTSVFPNLAKPQDASYFAIATIAMPAGMLGVLLSAIFAATMSSMSAAREAREEATSSPWLW